MAIVRCSWCLRAGRDQLATLLRSPILLAEAWWSVLRGGFSRVEQTLPEGGRAASVIQQRMDFQDVMRARLTCELFILAPTTRSPDSRPRRWEHDRNVAGETKTTALDGCCGGVCSTCGVTCGSRASTVTSAPAGGQHDLTSEGPLPTEVDMSHDLALTDPVASRADVVSGAFACVWTNGGLDSAWMHVASGPDIATTPHPELGPTGGLSHV